MSHLKDNTCLTKLKIWHSKLSKEFLRYIITILEHNKTLQHLYLSCNSPTRARIGITIEAIQTISRAISDNNTLQILKIDVGMLIKSYEEVRKNPHQLDPRISIIEPSF